MRIPSKRYVCMVGVGLSVLTSVAALASANSCHWWTRFSCCALHKDFILTPDCVHEPTGTTWTCRGALHPTIRADAGVFVLASHGWGEPTASNGSVQCQFRAPTGCGTLPGTCIYASNYTVVNCADYPQPTTPSDCDPVSGG